MIPWQRLFPGRTSLLSSIFYGIHVDSAVASDDDSQPLEYERHSNIFARPVGPRDEKCIQGVGVKTIVQRWHVQRIPVGRSRDRFDDGRARSF